MKQRITSLDLRIITGELQELVLNYRLSNIYNLIDSSRQYVLKFSIPDSKRSVMIDCGNKIHSTEYERPIAPTPSNFVTKLRKHLKTRRLTSVKQVGNDRILVFQFSDGMFYLVLEFFSAGNILLLDHDRKILSLQRVVNDLGADNDKYAVNEIYKAFDEELFGSEPNSDPASFTEAAILQWVQDHKTKSLNADTDKKKRKVFSIHKLLFVNASYLSSDLIFKTLSENDINASSSCLELEKNADLISKTLKALKETDAKYHQLLEKATAGASEGVIVEKKNPLYNADDKDSVEYTFDEFHPFTPQKESSGNFKFRTVKGYNKTLDDFFSTIESTKYALRVEQQKQHAQKRLNNAKNERNKQIESLKTQQNLNEKKGNAITYYADLVETCKDYIQSMLNKQMDWVDIENIVVYDSSKGKPEAKPIKTPLNLIANKIKLQLPDPDFIDEANENSSASESSSESESDSDSDDSSDSDSDSNSDSDSDSDLEDTRKEAKKTKGEEKKKPKKSEKPTVNVDIDLGLSAFANARIYFDSKKVAVNKQTKVEKSSNIALKNADKKIQKDLAKNLKNEVDALRVIRPKFWFEKYFWFVTSDNYLCLAGRDDSQTDMIYYRHFNDEGYLVSSDIEGSLKVFILNPFPGEDISPTTLYQAGIFALSTSSAWNAKVSSSSWWLKGHEVTKKEYDGSLLGPGRFNYKNKVNHLPPCQLVMGFGFYWLADEETAQKYTTARTNKQSTHGLKVDINNKKKDLENMTLSKPEKKESAEKIEYTENESKQIQGEEASTAATIKLESDLTKLDIRSDKKEAKNVRGKKGKLKKINEKYADQDEEERRLRMEVLGTLKQVEAEKQRRLEEAKQQAIAKEKKYAQTKKGAERDKRAEERELQKYLEADDDASGISYLELIDSLLSKPEPSDRVATAVPVFAPWNALSKFKYKVKIQPGMGKKGKSVTDSMHYFTTRKVDAGREDTDLDWPEEHEILSSLKPNDLNGVISVNKVKLVLPGGNASDNRGKRAGKKGKK